MSTAIQKYEPPTFDIEGIFKLAVEKGQPDTVTHLMAVRRELRAERAKKCFDDAMAAFQSECPVIEKRKAVMNKDGRTVRYHYAPLDDILAQVKGLLAKHDFRYTVTTETRDKSIKSICKVTHCDGHFELSEFEVPIDPQAFMSEQQKFAAALTYSKRYAFCNAFGILTGDEDNDANTKKEKQSGPGMDASADDRKLKKKLVDLTRDVSGVEGYALTEEDKGIITQHLVDEAFITPEETLQSLAGERLAAVVKKLEEKK